ncbi:hypothetical protein PVK06_029976 [Gossypium arboreum]|uniref:Uncharacterized protein n=1 Tax=Gossypium arboreum TaxID=29729 RepID=A0ABR0NPH5_GOSAR|nr:hypothetical protein PVK06_029976 [Gossypium arboreum]
MLVDAVEKAKAMKDIFFDKNGLTFLTSDCFNRYLDLRTKGFIEEENIEDASFAEHGIDTFLNNNGLLSTVDFVNSYVRELMLELYANLLLSTIDSKRKLFQKVYVRGYWYEINPVLIQNVLNSYNRNTVELEESLDETFVVNTNNIYQSWHEKGSIRAFSLSIVYVVFFKITTRN